jgi:hypothetical protein
MSSPHAAFSPHAGEHVGAAQIPSVQTSEPQLPSVRHALPLGQVGLQLGGVAAASGAASPATDEPLSLPASSGAPVSGVLASWVSTVESMPVSALASAVIDAASCEPPSDGPASTDSTVESIPESAAASPDPVPSTPESVPASLTACEPPSLAGPDASCTGVAPSFWGVSLAESPAASSCSSFVALPPPHAATPAARTAADSQQVVFIQDRRVRCAGVIRSFAFIVGRGMP